jgi:hypothetical protein
MARPNFPMMGINLPGISSNLPNISHPPSIQMNMMPPPLGGYPGIIPPQIGIPGKILFLIFLNLN